MPHSRRRRRRSRGVAPIIGTILILAMTIVVFTILFSFRFYTPASPPTVTFLIHSGGSNPVWGDGTDVPTTGGYSLLNTTQIIIASVSSLDIPLSEVEFTFVCDNDSQPHGNTTILVQGSLQDMTWFPGLTSSPATDAPKLGWCASFDPEKLAGSFGTYYNRLGLFIPISAANVTLQAGDTFLLYIHNGGYPLDYRGDCSMGTSGTPCLDGDDYHGAPPWCFTSLGACTIYLTYTGSPASQLAVIPVSSLAPPAS